MRQGLWGSVVAFTAASSLFAADGKQAELARFQGNWQVVELVEDGKVIPREAFRDALPSGGRFEVIEDTIVFTSPHDGHKHAKTFSIDPTQYPKAIEISANQKKDGWGIYRFDEERLVICVSHPEESPRPEAFSAKEGSQRTLMVLERAPTVKEASLKAEKPAPPRQTPEGTTAKLLTDAEVSNLLKGTWRYTDSAGALFISFASDGTFRTVRESPEVRLFQKVFVQTPVSTGKWQIHDGELTFQVTSSIHASRVGGAFPFTVRSISDKDLIFVDYLGRLGQAAKVR
ncbi:MAG: TIGR03067 domain-containing protein [Planctomycetaceae bacterium]